MRATPLAVVLALTLGACSQISGPPRPLARSELPAPPVTCAASLTAKIDDEPLAPEGVKLDALPPGAAEWFFTELLPWARQIAKRLDQGQRWCASLGRPPDPG